MGPTLPDLGFWVQDRGIDGADRRKYRLSYLLACINLRKLLIYYILGEQDCFSHQISTFFGPLVGPFGPIDRAGPTGPQPYQATVYTNNDMTV